MERSLKYIKYSLYFYAALFLLLNIYNLVMYQVLDQEVIRGLARGIFVGYFTYYMFKNRVKWVYWLNLVGATLFGVAGLVAWVFILMFLPEYGEVGEDLSVIYGVLLPLASVPLLFAAYHLVKKDVKVYLTSGSQKAQEKETSSGEQL